MQLHVAKGGKCVQDIETRLGQSNFLQMQARQIAAVCHHEPLGRQGHTRKAFPAKISRWKPASWLSPTSTTPFQRNESIRKLFRINSASR